MTRWPIFLLIHSFMDFDRLHIMFYIPNRVDAEPDENLLVRRIVTTPLNDKEDMFGCCESNELLRKHNFSCNRKLVEALFMRSLN